MKKTIGLCIAICFVCSFALDKITIPQRGVAGATITASKYNENLDTIASKVNNIVDTLRYSYPAWKHFANGDSVFRFMKIDTISSADSIYSLYGRIDTLGVGKIVATQVDINGGSIDGVIIGAASAQDATFDSTYAAKTTGATADFTTALGLTKPNNGSCAITSTNSTNGSGSYAGYYAASNTGSVLLYNTATSYTTSGLLMAASAGFRSINNTGGFNLFTQDAYPVRIGTNNTSRIFVDSDGEVGVGNTSPSAKFHVTGGIRCDSIMTDGSTWIKNVNQQLSTTSAPTFATVNTGNGNYELYAMNQNVRTTDAVTFDSVYSPKGIKSDAGLYSATLNTGNGNYELYAMNQNVRTTDTATFAGAKISGDSAFIFRTVAVPCTLTGVSGTVAGQIRITRMGQIVIITPITAFTGTSDSAGCALTFNSTSLLEKIYPSSESSCTTFGHSYAYGQDNGTYISVKGSTATQNFIELVKSDGSAWTTSGTKSVIGFAFIFSILCI